MRRSEAGPSAALRGAVAAQALPAQPRPEVEAAARSLARAAGGAVRAVVFFGSRKTRPDPDPWSAYDFFVVTDGYRRFYRGLRASGALRRSPWLVAALNAWLPPNQVAFSAPPAAERGAPLRVKCAVISERGFRRETSRRRRDHFCLGRLFQPAEVVYSADDAARAAALEGLAAAHAMTYRWARPWLPERFDVDAYCRALLRISLSREIRPEPEGRAEQLWQAQRACLAEVYAVLLRDLEAAGELVRGADGRYALARPVGRAERLALELYFRWSLGRATLRWFKYMITFEDWLEYILHKARRHTGRELALTPRERRLPLVFLWPRLLEYLRRKDRWGRQP